jgi:trehalose 6-phosphate phosphatase
VVLKGVKPAVEKRIVDDAVAKPTRRARHAFQAWSKIIVKSRQAPHLAVFLDFDGTLVRFQRRPGDVRLPAQAKEILARLAGRDNLFLAIVSGRKRDDLVRLVGLRGVQLFGLQGSERSSGKPAIRSAAQRALLNAKREVRSLLAPVPGIWIEDKGAIFTIHYRGAKPTSVERARQILTRILAPSMHFLHVLNGAKSWEVLPLEIGGKGAAVLTQLRELPEGTVAVYIGDDGTDETALAVLKDHISVRVGESKNTKANFYLSDPSEVLQFLRRLEREISRP